MVSFAHYFQGKKSKEKFAPLQEPILHTILGYNASVVKIYGATQIMARF
jgi:hypothetical protein